LKALGLSLSLRFKNQQHLAMKSQSCLGNDHTRAATQVLLVWQRRIPIRQTEAWLESVAWVGAQNCVISMLPSAKSAKLQIFGQTEKSSRSLLRQHGGSVVRLRPSAWLKAASARIVLPFPPYLCVVSEGDVPPPWKKLPRLLIPAGMAFGTGDHATTAMCLRQLLKRGQGKRWRLLDLGTGSGILALAAAGQGHEVTAMDFDPESIRTARANQALNTIRGKLHWVRADVTTWEPAGTSLPFDLITANLFSALLQKSLPKMKRWLRPGAEMILSGILRTQSDDVLQTLSRLKLEVVQILRKGKWVCLIVRKNSSLVGRPASA
jgi:ribosomal protein L11 methyltransferase